MKKLLAMLLALSMLFALAACGEKPTDEVEPSDIEIEENADSNSTATEAPEKDEEKPAEEKKDDEKKPEDAQKPAEKPEEKPAQQPEEKPAEKPAQTQKTVGSILLADFKARAGGAASALSIAEGLISNSIIPFMGGAMEVEPGLLAGFGNTEITGFKSGATFMPMMGSVAFVGYVFELESGANVNDFIAKLKSNADLRWNVCVEADEMVTGSVGNKVFFVMCPKQFEQ